MDSANGNNLPAATRKGPWLFVLFCLAAIALVAVTASPGRPISIHEASKAGKLADVETCIKSGASVNGFDSEGYTPLLLAAFEGHGDIAERLLASGADVNGCDELGYWTPLHAAASQGHASMVLLLIERGAEVNARDDADRTPLRLTKKQEVADALRQHGGTE